LAYHKRLDTERYWKKSHYIIFFDDAKSENIEENVVTAALEAILLNASWLFSTSKDESLNGELLKQDNPQDSGHDL
jgi:hypothetical protein